MKLFFSPASPYVRKVVVAAWERGVRDQIELLDSAAHPINRDPEIVALNATGKVPCGILADGAPIFDSRVLCQYVDSMAAEGPSLYPEAQRFEVLTLEALADSILDACLLCRYETVLRPESFYWPAWYDSQMDKIDSGLDDLETRWFALLSTADFHAGAIAVACTLGYLDFRFPDKDWRLDHPNLARWFDEHAATRQSMQQTMPEG